MWQDMDSSNFYAIEQSKLFLEFKKITLFTKHGPTLGAYRESILRDYLRTFTAESLHIKSGFVVNNNAALCEELSDHQTKQIDCMVYNPNSYVPLLHTKEFAVIQAESLYAAIEVKSALTFYKQEHPQKSTVRDNDHPLGGGYRPAYRWAGTLVDALLNIKSIADAAYSTNQNYFTAILAYKSTFDPILLFDALDNEELQLQLSISHLSQLPEYICIPGHSLTHLGPKTIFGEYAPPPPFVSCFDLMKTCPEHDTLPLAFFTAAYSHNISHKLNPDQSVSPAVFDPAPGPVKILCKEFPLNAEGML